MAFFIIGYAGFLIQLTNQPTVRRAFYFGLATGFAGAAVQAFFFAEIFKAAAVVLWIIFGFWIGLFAAISCGCIRRLGNAASGWLIPVIWTGTEYFRSELYYLRFSWLNIGYAFSNVPHAPFNELGVYGVGFVVVFVMSALCFLPFARNLWMAALCMGLAVLMVFARPLFSTTQGKTDSSLNIAGVQMELPPEHVIPEILNHALAKNPRAEIFVMSEYTLEEGGVPDSLREWCRKHSRFLVFGGKDVVTNDIYYDTAFVIGTNGETVFKQAKCVPVQFMKDGLPATRQQIWDSPWGRIGICICYDLSYTHVTDALVRDGAQMLIVPSMDVEDWGRHEHELHFRVAQVRAAENGIPIFRVASSGISQADSSRGEVIAHTSIPGRGDILSAQMQLPAYGSIPIDRVIAPFCVIVTGAVTAILLFLEWQGRRPEQKSPVAHMSHKLV